MADEPTTWTNEQLDELSKRPHTADGKPIYRLTTGQYGVAQEKLAELTKIADKLGCKPIMLEVLSTEQVTRKDELTALETIVTYVNCTVSGDAPKINGWIFVARVEHHELGNLIAVAPNMDGLVDTSAYRATFQKCDHCQQYRQRKDTFLVTARFPKGLTKDTAAVPPVWYDSDGEEFTFDILQVGSSCLKDFLGHSDPNRIIRYLENLHAFVNELSSDADDEMRFGGGGQGEPLYSTTSFLSHVAAIIRQHGWMPKGKAVESGKLSTVDRVWDNIDRIEHPRKHDLHYEQPVMPTDADTTEATAAHNWLTTWLGAIPLEQRNDFQQNLYVAAGGKTFERRNAGFVACVIDQYHRHLGKVAEASKTKRVNAHFGEAGDRVKLTLTVTYVFEWDGSYGPSFKHIFLDGGGRSFTWSTGSVQLERGAKYVIVGTIKEHSEYQGTKQTVLTRCKVMERKEK